VAGAFNKISSHQADVNGNSSRAELPLHLRALSLAGLEWPESRLHADSSSIECLSSVVPGVLADLEAKRIHLKELKKKRSAQSLPKIETPDSKTKKFTPDTPSIMDAVQSIKRVFNEEVLSPRKSQKADAGLLEYFHKVIHTFETQIDGLLADLKSTNEAMEAKNQLFADLEHLVAHLEMERDRLKSKLDAKTDQFRELEQRSRESEQRLRDHLIKAKEDARLLVSSTSAKDDSKHHSKVTAGRLIANFVSGKASEKSMSDKSKAFRKWSCQLSASSSSDQQQQIISALTRELGSTKETLGMLKKYRQQKHRSGGHDQIN